MYVILIWSEKTWHCENFDEHKLGLFSMPMNKSSVYKFWVFGSVRYRTSQWWTTSIRHYKRLLLKSNLHFLGSLAVALKC